MALNLDLQNNTWLHDRTILYVLHGSRSYGTFHAASDYDYKGVAVAPRAYRDGFLQRFEQQLVNEPDATIFDVRKFFKLAADCNPNIIEVLWTDSADIEHCTPEGQLLIDHKKDFLSRKAVFTFSGYAMSQLKRIRSHKKWLLEPPTHQPVRAEFDLPPIPEIPKHQRDAAFAAIRKRIDHWELDLRDMAESDKIDILVKLRETLVELHIASSTKFAAAARLIGYDENFIHLLERERKFKEAVKNWQQYNDWKRKRNKKRAALEANFGYDTKHGMHLVRLMRMCEEILTEGIVRVKRPDAVELIAIRNGVWSYDKLIGFAEEQEQHLLEVAKKSELPKRPNRKKLDQLCCEITEMVENR
jgi:uncharacterized protein